MKTVGKGPYDESQRIAYLVSGYLRKTLTPAEHDELDEWVTASESNQRLFEELVTPHILEQRLKEYNEPNEEAALERIKSKIKFDEPKVKRGNKFLRYSIAASIVLIAGIAITYMLMKKPASDKPIALLQPGGNHAQLITNGKIFNLDEIKNGLVEASEGSEVLKTADGVISYEKINSSTADIEMHELRTPAGGQYQVKLPDGSMVWLNAGSRLRYPNIFTGNERVVELEGEAYFEIAKVPLQPPPGEDSPLQPPQREDNPLQPPPGEDSRDRLLRDARNDGDVKTPFIVKLRDGAMVRVTGTHFNVMAYANEAEIKTTLLEGSVKVKSEVGSRKSERKENGEETTLKPGEQASLVSDEWRVVSGVNTDAVVAWKNGQFKFKDATIEEIMRQVARWYDAEIEYKGKVDYHFSATIERSEPLSKLLELLEITKRVKFEIEGRKVVVMP